MIKRMIKELLLFFGFNISRVKKPLVKLLHQVEIDLVFDIGANKGQFASYLFENGYKGKVISFEPVSSAFSILEKRTNSNKSWIIAERCAIGEKDGITKINISKSSDLSSILPLTSTIAKIIPDSKYIGTENVKMCKLDTVATQYLTQGKQFMVKIDVQGYEDKIVKGGKNTIKKAQAINMECSLIPLYKGETSFSNRLKAMEKMGFYLFDIKPLYRDRNTGRLLQIDCVFLKREKI